MDFGDWLQEELNKRGWNYSELARRCDLVPAQISRLITSKRNAGPDLCIAIAQGLELPRSEVFRARGWLISYPDDPYGPKVDPRAQRLAENVSTLPLERRETTLELMEFVLDSVGKLTDKINESPAD